MKIRSIVVLSLACLFLGFPFSFVARAQSASTGALAGSVIDSSGAVVVGAEVISINEASGETKTVTTQDSGRYTIPLLPPGTYRVQAKKNGFVPVSSKPFCGKDIPGTTTANVGS